MMKVHFLGMLIAMLSLLQVMSFRMPRRINVTSRTGISNGRDVRAYNHHPWIVSIYKDNSFH